jgi:predicted nucleic acid-binding protein
MELVVDANIFFSALIKDGVTRKPFFNDRLQFYTPEYIFQDNNHTISHQKTSHLPDNRIIPCSSSFLSKILCEKGQ